MNENLFDDQFDQKEESFDFVALLFRYLNYWYFFAASVFLVAGAMYLYLKTITPVYDVSASVLIEDLEKGNTSRSMMDLENLGLFSSTNNFDNELEILRSRTLVKDVVINSGFYINYAKKGLFRNDDLYKASPINVWMPPEDAANLVGGAKLSIKINSQNKIFVVATITDAKGEQSEFTEEFDKLPGLLSTPHGTFSFDEGVLEDFTSWTPEDELIVSINNPIAVAKGYSSALAIKPSSKTTTIANITFKTSSKQRGSDFIHKLVELYNKGGNDYKNEVSIKTAEFINERIIIINNELGTTEAELEAFKKESNITDLKSEADLALAENSAYKQRIVENSTQLRLVKFLKDYANEDKNKFEVLPINVGLSDDGLSRLISSYNEMLLERKRLLVTSSESNPTVVNLDARITSMRRNVITTIASVYEGLLIKQGDIEREANVYAGRISSAPTKERVFVEIARQQEIQSTIYLMLLQKREENILTLASTAINARIFNEPMADSAPIAPNKKMYMLIALILGLGIPMGVVYLKDLFSFKIKSRDDVEKITSVPILADIPMCTTLAKENSIVVQENKNDVMTESFRALRTNMLFMLKKGQKVAMITSTSSTEGKSFISANLAKSLALMGKKVVIVGLDIRKPDLYRIFGVSGKMKGISNYLSNSSIDLLSLLHTSESTPNLSILFGGTIPPNPTELLSRDTLDEAIEILKDNFDYIILDTAPIGMVTDTQIIARVADVSLYVCRANYTNKSSYRFINELQRNNKLPNLSTVINNVDLRKRRYGYGNKYGYGYGAQYGYGAGYGNEEDK